MVNLFIIMFSVKNVIVHRCHPSQLEIFNFSPSEDTYFYSPNGLNEPLIPDKVIKQYDGTHKFVDSPLFNNAGIASFLCEIGKKGLYYLILPEGKIIDQLILSKSEIDLSLYFSGKSLLYSFYNPTEVERLFLDIRIADDERKIYQTIKKNPKDISFPSNEIDRIINSSNQKQIKEKNSSSNKSKEIKHLKAKNWSQVTIELVSDDSILVKAPDFKTKRFNYTDLGMRDDRRGDMPNQLWDMVERLAVNNGKISVDEISLRERSKIEKTIQRMRTHFKTLFGIEGMPINRYSKKHGYVTQFNIKDCRPTSYNQPFLE